MLGAKAVGLCDRHAMQRDRRLQRIADRNLLGTGVDKADEDKTPPLPEIAVPLGGYGDSGGEPASEQPTTPVAGDDGYGALVRLNDRLALCDRAGMPLRLDPIDRRILGEVARLGGVKGHGGEIARAVGTHRSTVLRRVERLRATANAMPMPTTDNGYEWAKVRAILSALAGAPSALDAAAGWPTARPPRPARTCRAVGRGDDRGGTAAASCTYLPGRGKPVALSPTRPRQYCSEACRSSYRRRLAHP